MDCANRYFAHNIYYTLAYGPIFLKFKKVAAKGRVSTTFVTMILFLYTFIT